MAVRTEGERLGDHTVIFNRGSASSQAYATRFGNKNPADVPHREAYRWLSRGLEEALIAFIGQAVDNSWTLRGALYEFSYPSVLDALRIAADHGADLHLVIDASPKPDSPRVANLAAITDAGLDPLRGAPRALHLDRPQHVHRRHPPHGAPVAVRPGSTNITEGGIFGHSNVGHALADPTIAAAYLGYWQQLSTDPTTAALHPWSLSSGRPVGGGATTHPCPSTCSPQPVRVGPLHRSRGSGVGGRSPRVLIDVRELSVAGCTLPGMGSELDGLVDAVEQSSVDLADTLLRESGIVCPPTAHFLSKHTAPPYLGSIATRPFRRGADAAGAVTALGVLPSVLYATQLVVVWEFSDLCAALELPGAMSGEMPNGLVVLDALMSTHTVRWHPFRRHVGPDRGDGTPTVIPEWGSPIRHPGGALPAPVGELLEVWRECHHGDVAQTRADLEAAGFLVTWAAALT